MSGSSYVPTLYEKYYDLMFDESSNKYDVSIRLAIIANCTNENEWHKINKNYNQNKEAIVEFNKQIEACMWSKSKMVKLYNYFKIKKIYLQKTKIYLKD